MSDVSPFSPIKFPKMPLIEGIKFIALESGIKYKNRKDLFLIEMPEETIVSGAFTKSSTASANILWSRKIIGFSKARILVVNSGNANAFNGESGEISVSEIVKFCTNKWKCKEEEVYFFSTGVIGEVFPYQKVLNSLCSTKEKLVDINWKEAAEAIMTTDTYPKISTKTISILGKKVTINGIAKGSGMIAPNMATMLAYIFTDILIEPSVLKKVFSEVVNDSFNSITVDSDTSTSDAALVFATGKAGNELITSEDNLGFYEFKEALREISLDLAHQIVKDGEGASKFITIKVTGAINNESAKKIAFSIGNSPLVKTAIAGEDPNWGRVIMAIGKSEEEININKISLYIGGLLIVSNNSLCKDYKNELKNYMKNNEIEIIVDVGVAKGSSTIWTCDFTHKYISINADYTS